MWERLRQDYRRLFGPAWPVWTGGALYGLVNILLFLHYKPWSTLDGVLNWGDNLFAGFGVGNPGALSPLLRSGSVINFGVLAGALLGALLAGQFGLRLAPRRELAKAAIGGVLMGVGAVLARGCNIGGFFSGWSAFSLHGLTMAAGLTVGAFLGARYLAWELERTSLDAGGGARSWLHGKKPQPYVGLALLVGLLIAAFAYLETGYDDRAVILLFGVFLGVVSQRSRICFVRAFREPFLTGDGGHARAVLLALLISAVGFAVVKYAIFERAEEFVRPTFWLGSLLGGAIFGLGMVLAGGCGGGTLWRIGEGQIQLMVALAGYVVAAAFVNDYLVDNDLISKLGREVFLPEMVGGWPWALVIMLGVVAVAYLVVQWADATGRLAALD